MKLPETFKSRHKIRDFQLCKMYCNGASYEEIQTFLEDSSKNKKITITRIQQILSENKDFVNANIGWGKSKRLNKLIQIADSCGDTLSKNKDIIDVMKEMRTEMEGEKSAVDLSQHTHFNFVYLKTNEDAIRTAQRTMGRLELVGKMASARSGQEIREDTPGDTRVDAGVPKS